MLDQHVESGADVTLATLPVEPRRWRLRRRRSWRGTATWSGFRRSRRRRSSGRRSIPTWWTASMGIYLFNTDVLLPALMQDAEDPISKHDFGHNILPTILGKYKMRAYNFVDENRKSQALYWRDVGTLDAYYDANMDVASVSPVFNLYDRQLADPDPRAAVSAGEVRLRRAGTHGHGDQLDRVGAAASFPAAVVRNSVLSQDVRVNPTGARFEHRVFAREYRAALPHQAGHHRPRRATARGHGHRLRRERRAEVLFRHAQRADGSDGGGNQLRYENPVAPVFCRSDASREIVAHRGGGTPLGWSVM